MLAFIDFTLVDILDIVLVGLIIFQLYRLTKGTVAIKIFFGILAIYLLWKLVSAFQMEMLGEILGQFIGVGVIALIIVFQQELRQFLLFIGSREVISERPGFMQRWFGGGSSAQPNDYSSIVRACSNMAKTKTGALIVIGRRSDPSVFTKAYKPIDAKLSSSLLESIFFKNSPLHDGAVIIREQRIVSAGGVLPVSEIEEQHTGIGMRHRAALGITEQTDALAIVVSEETGKITLAEKGVLSEPLDAEQLKKWLSPDE